MVGDDAVSSKAPKDIVDLYGETTCEGNKVIDLFVSRPMADLFDMLSMHVANGHKVQCFEHLVRQEAKRILAVNDNDTRLADALYKKRLPQPRPPIENATYE